MKPLHGLFPLGALLTVLASSTNLEAAKGGNGGGGGGGGGGSTQILLARIQFDPFDAVRSDGVQACTDPAEPIGAWDYWDWRDTALTDNGCDAGTTADVSSGGRLHFYSINLQGAGGPPSSPRWLVLDFNNVVEGPNNPDLDALYEGGVTDPPYDSTPGIDNVKTVVSLDNMFKSGATQNPLIITIRNCDDPAACNANPTGYSLAWVEDLNIIFSCIFSCILLCRQGN